MQLIARLFRDSGNRINPAVFEMAPIANQARKASVKVAISSNQP